MKCRYGIANQEESGSFLKLEDLIRVSYISVWKEVHACLEVQNKENSKHPKR